MCTHEQFIQSVRELALTFNAQTYHTAPLTVEQLRRIGHSKLTYGRGTTGLRGVTQYNAWKHECDTDLIEICALGEESWVQLAGTTLHELGHVAAGFGNGHNKEWKACCASLGLRRVHAAGTHYMLANFHPWIRMRLALMPKPSDGNPSNAAWIGTIKHTKTGTARVCTQGIGTRGGKSRGIGSGSRQRKYVCDCGQIIRAATDTLAATHDVCGSEFQLA